MLPKTQKEINLMHEGGKRLREVLEKTIEKARPGISKIELDQRAEKEILRLDGKPSFKMVPGYFWSTCLTINDEVVHGIPDNDILKEGDILGIDIGFYYQGFHTDLAKTIPVGRVGKKILDFLKIGEQALETTIKKAKLGNYVGDLSWSIQTNIEKAGYSIVRMLTGHGVGKKLHEEPNIPGFLSGDRKKTKVLREGMTLAIEVIYNYGTGEVVLEPDGWTIATKDGKISGLFEETVAIWSDGPLILTR